MLAGGLTPGLTCPALATLPRCRYGSTPAWEARYAVGGDGELARGREAARRLAWADAYAALSLADQSSSLAAEDLELLATAAYLLGHVEDCLRALQRAQQLHAEAGDPRRAARCAFWLAFHLGNAVETRRRPAVGSPGPTGFWSTSRRTAPSAATCCSRWRSSTSRPATPRPRGSWRRGQPRSADAPATPTWSRSRCTSKAAPWCGGPGRARPWPPSTRPWWPSSPASSRPWSSARSTAATLEACQELPSCGAPTSGRPR